MPEFTDELNTEQPLVGKRILFAEDQEHLRTIIVMMLEELGAEVVPVGDGNSVLAEYVQGNVDLVLMDIKMAGLAGTEAYERLMEIDAAVKVVLTSGAPPESDLLAVLKERNDGFIEKPFNLTRLGDVISRVLNGEHVVLSSP